MSEWFASWFDSPYYHVLYDNRDESEANAFMTNLMEFGNFAPDTRILDLACGKGRHSVYLNNLGYHVTGMDLSAASIQEASKFQNEKLVFLRQDMRDPLPLNNYDLVLNLFTSFGYFENQAENLTVLKNIHRSLSPQGKLVIDFFNADCVLKNLVPSETVTKKSIEFRLERFVENGFIKKKISFTAEGKPSEFCEKVQLFGLNNFEQMLAESGFEIKNIFGDYNLGKFVAAESKRLILIAEKKKNN
ncbi:MAG: class I SAM-dependent methyltransferase [Crocinitomicaceae bacterium]|nr:class I SAM-dependent methyltransferase [Crocinitomicaceae bacterium]